MPISTLRRRVKNVSYSSTQVKVREATSNAPADATPELMAEIANLTNNAAARSEIMVILWKRLNDHGKNWRHVFKSLVLLDFLIKRGSENVVEKCRENIYVIETLKDFQYKDGKIDHGLNVRKNAENLVALLKDEERLKNERQTVVPGDGDAQPNESTQIGNSAVNDSELEEAKPGNTEEEEMQLQIVMALSREENSKEEEARWDDADRLRSVLEESKQNAPNFEGDAFGGNSSPSSGPSTRSPTSDKSNESGFVSILEDIKQLNFYNPIPIPTPVAPIPINNPYNPFWDGNNAAAWAANPFQPTPSDSSNDYANHFPTNPFITNNDPWSTAPFPFTGAPAKNDPWLPALPPRQNLPFGTTPKENVDHWAANSFA